jgi:hypothetical protein
MALRISNIRLSLVKRTRQCCLVFCLGLLGTVGSVQKGSAQEAETGQRTVSNPRAPIFWADGITQISDLDAYKRVGFNTVVVRLTWLANENNEISAVNLAPQRAFAEAAAERDLKVIYALPAAPTGLDGSFRLSANSEAYISLWTTWLQDAVATLRTTPNLIGWMLPDDPRGLPIFDDIGFKRWLFDNYANRDIINRQWSSSFESIDDISIADVNELAATWRGDTTPTAQELATGASEITRRAFGRDWAFHPAALSLANYKWDAYRALLTAWVGALRGEDNSHLVFSGRTPDYAQLLSLPAGIDISMPDLSPGVAEDDIVTHNPQAIDIARRAGKFGVLPMFSPHQSAQLPIAAIPGLTRRWIEEAWSRGARGIGFDSWGNVRQVPGLPAAVSEEIGKLSQPSRILGWGQAPVNTTAVLLTPLADGATLQFGTPPDQYPRGLYGFGDDFIRGEPSNLVWMLRWGTAFGGVDYLSPDDLNEAPLERYTTLLAPQTLSATSDTVTALSNYVTGGGVLVADLGLGALQNGGQVNAMPPALATLFGVPGSFDVQPLSFNLNGVGLHPLLPTWSEMTRQRPGVALTLGDGPNSAAFAGPVGFSPIPPTAQIIASGPRIPQNSGGNTRLTSTQLTINNVGRGYAIFAPFRLWSYWKPGQNGFDTFFGEIMSRGATVVMAGATSMVPSPVNAKMGATFFPEIVNHASGITLTNHNSPDSMAMYTAVQTSGAGDWLWSGGITHFPPNAEFPVASGRRAPIEGATEYESQPHAVVLYSVLDPGEVRPMNMRPIAAQNRGGGPLAAQIEEESEQQLKVNLWSNALTVVRAEDSWRSAVGDAATIRLTVVSAPDGYQAMPGTRHRITVTDYSKPTGKNKFLTTEKFVVAGADGRLVFEFNGASCAVTITPAGVIKATR